MSTIGNESIPTTGKRIERRLGSLKHSSLKAFVIFSMSLYLSEQLIDLNPTRLIEFDADRFGLIPEH